MALRLWVGSASGLSRLAPSCHRVLCHNISTVRALSVASSAPGDGHSRAALEDAGPASEKKKERLSRQERTVLVESFVIKHMEAHGGAFPSVSTVLKETGGGRSAVKDILNDVESRFTQLTSKETSPNSSSAGRTTNNGTLEKEFGVGAAPIQLFGQDAFNETSMGKSSDDSEESDEEFDNEDVSDVETIEELGGIPEAERKSVTFTNGHLIGSSHGEIETHSGLWSRLKKLGSQSQRSGKQPTSQESPPVALNGSSDDSTKENEVTPGSVALGFSDVTDLDIKNCLQLQQVEERHGLFVRYLSPQATPNDLKEAFSDCGEIVRAQAMKPKTHQKYTYGFVDFKTAEALQKALEKDKVYIKGVRIRKEPSSSTPKPSYRNGKSSSVDISSTQNTGNSSGISYTEKHGDDNANVEFKGKTSVVRLNNVGPEVGAEQIQAACELIGRVEKVVVRCDGLFDVYFHETELKKMPRIMSSLNEVKLGGQFLQAQPSSYIDTNSYLSLARRKDGEEWLQHESERMLARVENSLKHLMVDVEDLQNLVRLRREYRP